MNPSMIPTALDRTTRSRSDAPGVCLDMGSGTGLLLALVLAGRQSRQEVYLAQATDYATAAEVEELLRSRSLAHL